MVGVVALIRIYGNFNNVEANGCIPLFDADDTKSEQVELKEGLRVLVWDASFEEEGVLELREGEWWARLLPGTGRRRGNPSEVR